MGKVGRIEITHNHWAELGPALRGQVDRETEITAREILADAQISMSGPKSGRMYGNHQASAWGESPAVDTGALRASGGVKQLAQGLWEIFFTARYASHLEYGTPRMEERPFLRPAVEKHRESYLAAIARLVGR